MFCWLFLNAFLCYTTSLTINTNGSISKHTAYQQLFFNITPGYSTIALSFQITNIDNSNLLAVASFAPIPNNLTLIDISNYFATNSVQLNFMDVISVIGQNKQNLNLAIPNETNVTTIYITLFNFDLPFVQTDKTYSLIINYLVSGKICVPCSFGTSLIYDSNKPLQCQCYHCPINFIGSWCQYFLSPLKYKQSQSIDILSKLKAYFRIVDKKVNVKLSVQELTNTNSIKLYIQYEYQEGSLAGKINCHYKGFSLPFQILVTSKNAQVIIPSNGYNILLTFQNTGNTLVTFALVYASTTSQTSDFMKIIIICSSIFLSIFFILIVCLIFRRCKNKNLTISNESDILNDKKILDSGQINKFFPEITGQSFYSSTKSKNNKNLNDQPQCSICFDKITTKHLVRITYCNHVFHSQCLQQWFQQTQKCPDCSQIFDITTSDQFRNKILQRHKDLAQTLTKSFWYKQISPKHKPSQQKTEMLSQSKSFQQLKIEDIESSQNL